MKKAILALFAALICYFGAEAQTANKVKELYSQQEFDQAKALIPTAIKESPKDVDLLIICGDIYADFDKSDSALIMYQKALDVKEDPMTIRKVAKAYTQINKKQEAYNLLKGLLKKDNKDIVNYLAMADLLIKFGGDSIKKAELMIATAKDKNPNIAEPYITLGDLYFAQQVYELAKDNYEAALKINPKLTDVRVKLATSYYWLANREDDKALMNELFNRSLDQWRLITKEDPKNARAYFEQGRLFYYAGKWVDASNALAEYMRLRPSASQTRWWLAQSLVNRAENAVDTAKPKILDSAIVHLEICANEIDSVKVRAKAMIAKAYYDTKRYDRAIFSFSELGSLPGFAFDAASYERFGWSYFRNVKADTANALNCFHKSIDLDKSKCGLMNGVARLHFSRKEYDDAIKYFKLRVEGCKDDKLYQDYFFIGYTYLTIEKADSAKPFIEKAISMDSNYITALITLGDINAKLNDNAEAKAIYTRTTNKVLENLTKAIETSKVDVSNKDNNNLIKSSKDNLSQLFKKMYGIYSDEKKLKDLVPILKQSLEVDPDNLSALLFLGFCYQTLGDKDNSCKYYKEVLKRDPKNDAALKNSKAVCN